jgi:hypothetical protein
MLDAISFERAYAQLNRRAITVVSRYTGSYPDAEDAVQIAWLQAWMERHNLDENKSLLGWICTVARRAWWHIRHPWKSCGKYQNAPIMIPMEEVQEQAIEGEQEQQAASAMLYNSIERMTVPWVKSNGENYQRPATPAMKETIKLLAQTGNAADVQRTRGVTESGNLAMIKRGIEALKVQWRLT